MRILLLEDDADTAAFVAKGLREAGHVLDTAGNGRDGLHRATSESYDVMIVDRMIPQIDGLSVVRAARAAGVETPVLMLTAMGGVADRVAGLEGGADDYLVKPFSFAELNARVNALARRPPIREQQTQITVGDLTLDRLRQQVRRAGEMIDLQMREYRLLEVLMLQAGRVVTRTMLLQQIWGFNFDPGTNIVETHISRLRGKIDRGGSRALIHTVRGAGYVLRAD